MHLFTAGPHQEFIFGLALASFFFLASSFLAFLFASIFSSFFLFKLAFSASVFSRGLKKPSRRLCWLDLRFLDRRVAPDRTRSSLNPFSSTRNLIKPSTSGDSHLKRRASWVHVVTANLRSRTGESKVRVSISSDAAAYTLPDLASTAHCASASLSRLELGRRTIKNIERLDSIINDT
ncbi:hypothetical protein KC345_g104 [Hortaea werneckii]|nr:hypothetical protein KC345_g104 [Hortaea werneckii]